MNRRWCCKKVILILDRKQASDCSCVNWLHIIGGLQLSIGSSHHAVFGCWSLCFIALNVPIFIPSASCICCHSFWGAGGMAYRVKLWDNSCDSVVSPLTLTKTSPPELSFHLTSTGHGGCMTLWKVCWGPPIQLRVGTTQGLSSSIRYINKYVFTNRNHSLAVSVNHRAVPVTFGTMVVFGKAFRNKNQGVAPTAFLKCQFLRVLCSSQWYVRVFSFLSCTVRQTLAATVEMVIWDICQTHASDPFSSWHHIRLSFKMATKTWMDLSFLIA